MNLIDTIMESRKSGLSDKVLDSYKKKRETELNTKTRGRKSKDTIAKQEKISGQLAKVGEVLKTRHAERMEKMEAVRKVKQKDLVDHFKTVAHDAAEHHGFKKLGEHHPHEGQAYIKHDSDSGVTTMLKVKHGGHEYGDAAGRISMTNSSGTLYYGYSGPYAKHYGENHEESKNKMTHDIEKHISRHYDGHEDAKRRASYGY